MINNEPNQMKQIQMVDLKGQYEKIKGEIDEAIADVLSSAAYINGYAVKSFQTDLEKYLDVKNVIPCANGTDALQIALMSFEFAGRRRSDRSGVYICGDGGSYRAFEIKTRDG